jgi:hypothetical protein
MATDSEDLFATLPEARQKAILARMKELLAEEDNPLPDSRLKNLELYAWVGEDELGSGKIGLKQAIVPAGAIAMVAIAQDKIDQPYIREQLQQIADKYKKSRYLVRFEFAEIVSIMEPEE